PTSSISGFGLTSSKRTAFSRCASAASARPAATTPLSVTSSARVTPNAATRSPTRAIAPPPWTSRVGTSTVRTVSTSTLTGRRAYRNAAATIDRSSTVGDLQLATGVEAGTLFDHERRHRSSSFRLDLGQAKTLARLRRVPDGDADHLVAVGGVALVRAQHAFGERA